MKNEFETGEGLNNSSNDLVPQEYNIVYNLMECNDGNFIVTGIAGSDLIDGKVPFVAKYSYLQKMDVSGNVLWRIQHGEFDGMGLARNAQDVDGNLYVLGMNWPNAYIGKYSPDGKTISQNSILPYSSNLFFDQANGFFYAASTQLSSKPDFAKFTITQYDHNYKQTGKSFSFKVDQGYSQNSVIFDLAVDSSGNIFITTASRTPINGVAPTAQYSMPGFIMKYSSNFEHEWTKCHGKGKSGLNNIQFDKNDNIIVSASDWITNLDTLKKYTRSYIIKYDQNGNVIWTTNLPGTGVTGSCEASFVKKDKDGNLYLTGMTTYALTNCTQHGIYDNFVAKFNSDGESLWYTQYGVKDKCIWPGPIELSKNGNIYNCPSTNAQLTPNPMSALEPNVLFEYSVNGWTQILGKEKSITCATDVCLDESTVVTCGYTTGKISSQKLNGIRDGFINISSDPNLSSSTFLLGASGASTTINSIASFSGDYYVTGKTTGSLSSSKTVVKQDAFIVKFSASGTTSHPIQFGNSKGKCEGRSIKLDSSGNIFVAGKTTAALSNNTQTGIEDGFISKYSSDSSLKWSLQLGDIKAKTSIEKISLDSSNNIIAIGHTTGSLDKNSLIGERDGFIAMYSSKGVLSWVVQEGIADATVELKDFVLDSSNNIYVVGSITTDSDFQEETKLIISKYDITGKSIWSKTYGPDLDETKGYAIAINKAGNLVIVGSTTGNLSQSGLFGKTDMAFLEISLDGAEVEIYQTGVSNAITIATNLVSSSSGDCFITGFTTGNFNGVSAAGKMNAFTMEYATPYALKNIVEFPYYAIPDSGQESTVKDGLEKNHFMNQLMMKSKRPE